MDRRRETIVVKVGGSLFDEPELAARLTEFLAARRGDRCVLIVGGGAAADFVRALDQVHQLGDVKAHALAIRSLDLTAHALRTIVPGLVVAETIAEVHHGWNAGQVPILVPRVPLELDPDPLPASWDVTTDSIAARIALILGANRLVLLKSVETERGTTRTQAGLQGLVDPRFAHEARAIPCVTVLNLRDPAGQEVELTMEEA